MATRKTPATRKTSNGMTPTAYPELQYRVTADGENIIYKTEAGEIKVPLKFKFKVFRKLRELLASDQADDLDAFIFIIDNTCGQDAKAKIDEIDSETVIKGMVATYFDQWGQKIGGEQGE